MPFAHRIRAFVGRIPIASRRPFALFSALVTSLGVASAKNPVLDALAAAVTKIASNAADLDFTVGYLPDSAHHKARTSTGHCTHDLPLCIPRDPTTIVANLLHSQV